MRTFTDLTEIKLVLLFVLKNVPRPLSLNDLTELVMKSFEVNYFSLTQYLSELVEGNYVLETVGELPFYSITEKGQKTLSYFLFNIAPSTKDKLLSAINDRYHTSLSSFVEADYLPDGNRFAAEMRVVEQGEPLFELTFPGLSRDAARRACARFSADFSAIYDELVGRLLSGQEAFRAVLFDLDGTLLNTLADLTASMNASLEAMGYPPHSEEEYRHLVGDGVYELARRALPEEARTEEHIKACVAGHNAQYEQRWHEQTTPYPGIRALLECLAHLGVKLGVLTNKPDAFASKIIAHYFPDIPFSCVMGQKEGRGIKPSPDGIFEAMDVWSLRAEEILYVGDSDVDMETGKNAGVFSAGALWGFRGKEELENAGAGYLAAHPLDLLRFFRFE